MNLPTFKIRCFTSDQMVLDKVFYSNIYLIPPAKEENNQIVVDIGAHVGYFSMGCLMAGYKVFAFEPIVDNLKLLFENLSGLTNFYIFPYGVHTEGGMFVLDKPLAPQVKNSLIDFAYLHLPESLETYTSDRQYQFPVYPLRTILNNIGQEIDYLKINIGYSEATILSETKQLDMVKNCCGEFSLDEMDEETFVIKLKSLGFTEAKVKPLTENRALFFASKGKLEEAFGI